MSQTSSSKTGSDHVLVTDSMDAEIDLSCRIPLLVMFGGAAFWLVVSAIFALISALHFHDPNFFADIAWLGYGRVRPAANELFLYGFAVPAGLGVGLWMLARLGRRPLLQPLAITLGVKLWNLGVLLGFVGILAGDATGFEWLDLPRYASLVLFLGYLLIALFGLLTFYQRRQRTLFVSQWFIVAAIFWFPWVFATANALLLVFPVRGVTQAVIAWWYAHNIVWIWSSLLGIAALFYFVPRLTRREIYSDYLALFTFWLVLLFGSWGGVPNSAPVPAWLPAASTVGTVLAGVGLLTFLLNLHHTLDGKWSLLKQTPSIQFFSVGLAAFVLAQILKITGSIGLVAETTDLTWFGFAANHLQGYGFLAMILFGAIYHIVPQLLGVELGTRFIASSVARLARVNFWLAAAGIALVAIPFAIGGIVQGIQLSTPSIAFLDVVKTSLIVVRITTIGDFLILAANVVFMLSLGRLVAEFYKARAAAAYADATAEIPATGAKA